MINISDVNVIISIAEQSGSAGEWYPLLYLVDEGGTASYKEYSSFAEVKTDFVAGTSVYDVANMLYTQDTPYKPKKLAVCVGVATVMTGLAEHMNKDWRQLIVVDGEYDSAISKEIETTEKMYFTFFKSKDALTAAKITDYDRTVGIVYTSNDVTNPEAALVGRTAGLEAGGFTYHSMKLRGVTAESMSPIELDDIIKAGGNAYVMKNSKVASHGGVVGSGEWIDVIDSKDYVLQHIRYDVQEVFLNNDKVAYTDVGISKIENAVRNVLKKAYNNGMIATNEDGTPAYTVNFPKRSATTTEDRASRNYPYGTFEFELAGAIHETTIKGAIVA